MATKTEMIEFIVQNTDNKVEDLEELNYNSVKKIFNTVEIIEEEQDDFNIPTSIEEEEQEPEKISKTFTIEVGDMSEEEIEKNIKSIADKFKEKIKIEEVEEVDFFSLSPVQRRAYQRSGNIPKKK